MTINNCPINLHHDITSHSAYDTMLTESNGVTIDGYIQILCRFLKSKVKVPPTFCLLFWIYIKFGYKNPSNLTPLDLVDIAS